MGGTEELLEVFVYVKLSDNGEPISCVNIQTIRLYLFVLTYKAIHGIISYKVKEDNTQTQKIFTKSVDKQNHKWYNKL